LANGKIKVQQVRRLGSNKNLLQVRGNRSVEVNELSPQSIICELCVEGLCREDVVTIQGTIKTGKVSSEFYATGVIASIMVAEEGDSVRSRVEILLRQYDKFLWKKLLEINDVLPRLRKRKNREIESKNKLGDFLREKRTRIGLTQGYIANTLGYTSPQFISNWERGIAQPPVDIMYKLSKLLRVHEDDLFQLVLEIAIAEATEKLRKAFKISN